MNIPDSIWSLSLDRGDTLGSRVRHAPPAVLPMAQREAFASTWKNRLEDAKASRIEDNERMALNILAFLEHHASEELVMLLWSDPKTVAIFAPASGKIIVAE